MMVSDHCQLDTIWDHLGFRPPSTSMEGYLNSFEVGKPVHCWWHHSLAGSWTVYVIREAELRQVFMVLSSDYRHGQLPQLCFSFPT